MRATRSIPRRALVAAALFATAAVLLSLVAGPTWADDRDLLRFSGATPYLFVVLDTSGSMAMKMGEQRWTPGGADGPDSRLYQAKQALYNVFKDVNDVHFGFATFNQEHAHAVSAHWIYYNETALDADWPIAFPRPDPDADGDGSALTELIQVPDVDENGNIIPIASDPTPPDFDTRVAEITGDVMTFGPPFVAGSFIEAGRCGTPLDLDTAAGRDQASSFAVGATDHSYLWLKTGGSTYLMEVGRPGNRPDSSLSKIGEDYLHVELELKKFVGNAKKDCGTPTSTPFDSSFGTKTARLDLRLDPYVNRFFYVNEPEWGPGGDDEETAPVWEWSDVLSDADYNAGAHPFTGKGWEGNYDSGVITGDTGFDNDVTTVDRFCASGGPAATCPAADLVVLKPVLQTVVSSVGRAMDKGDVLPFHWTNSWKTDFLSRLAPNYDPSGTVTPDFRAASYFSTSSSGVLQPSAPPPLLAADRSPLAKAINDVRCWYLGEEGQAGSNKCKDTSFVEYAQGWEDLACTNDPEFGCRRPYIILISDGEDSGGRGEDANGDIGALNSHSGIQTWALNLGDPSRCGAGGGLHPIVQAGKGECINVDSQAKLRQALQQILGKIRTEARSFASAAVPSVQATVEQKIFLTSFNPMNDSSVWEGSIFAFLKPLPTDNTGKPATQARCDQTGSITVSDRTQGCLLWDAGKVLHDTQLPASGTDYLDLSDPDLRRVFYARRATSPGEWANSRRLFDPVVTTVGSETPQAVRFDLFDGFQVGYNANEGSPADATVNQGAADIVNNVIDHTLAEKTGTVSVVDPVTGSTTDRTDHFLLGDIFHSTPVVVGTPANTVYFAGDTNGEAGGTCEPDDGLSNRGYRCFFSKQRLRRKMLIVGSDDGMLHVLDAGIFRETGSDHFSNKTLDNEFDNGTGKELFAYVPRVVFPTLKQLAGADGQQYTVDGTVTVADVFIDPVKEAASTFPDPDEREWRTVVVGGFREGGLGYFGLDITQPDPVDTDADLGFVPTNTSGNNGPGGDPLPECTTDYDPTVCGPVPFPSVLWEFTDALWDPNLDGGLGRWLYADEECFARDPDDGHCTSVGNQTLDLGFSWSVPNIGRIRVCKLDGTKCNPDISSDETADDDLVDRFVAVFGGGMDVGNKTLDWRRLSGETAAAYQARIEGADVRGNWIYMVDIETGQVIYKQQLAGAVPSEPAAVDTDGDGYFDRIYVGTLAGYLYRADLGTIAGEYPAVEMLDKNYFDPTDNTAYSEPVVRLPDDVWKPVVIFDANWDDSSPTVDPRPIYQRPSVIFVADQGKYALAFGTGDRENLWSVDTQDDRFYVFLDQVVSTASVGSPLTEASLEPIAAAASPNDVASNYLVLPGGWSMDLAENERVITDGFALSGLMIFSTFVPDWSDDEGNPINPGCTQNSGGQGANKDTSQQTCAKVGTSNVYVVNATNGNGLLFDSTGAATRSKEIPTFVTNPFAEPGTTKQAGDSNSTQKTADDLTPDLIKVMDSLKALFPAQCKFANYRIDVKTIAADTSLQFIAPVPVCIIERNWKEF